MKTLLRPVQCLFSGSDDITAPSEAASSTNKALLGLQLARVVNDFVLMWGLGQSFQLQPGASRFVRHWHRRLSMAPVHIPRPRWVTGASAPRDDDTGCVCGMCCVSLRVYYRSYDFLSTSFHSPYTNLSACNWLLCYVMMHMVEWSYSDLFSCRQHPIIVQHANTKIQRASVSCQTVHMRKSQLLLVLLQRCRHLYVILKRKVHSQRSA